MQLHSEMYWRLALQHMTFRGHTWYYFHFTLRPPQENEASVYELMFSSSCVPQQVLPPKEALENHRPPVSLMPLWSHMALLPSPLWYHPNTSTTDKKTIIFPCTRQHCDSPVLTEDWILVNPVRFVKIGKIVSFHKIQTSLQGQPWEYVSSLHCAPVINWTIVGSSLLPYIYIHLLHPTSESTSWCTDMDPSWWPEAWPLELPWPMWY